MLYVPKTEQFSHQKRVLDETWDREGYALWWEQGTGKSKGLIDNAGALYAEHAIDGLLAIAPNLLHRNFCVREVPKHMPDDILGQTKVLVWDQARKSTKMFKNAAAEFLAHPGLKILGMSYDGLMTEEGRALVWEFLKDGTGKRKLGALDESGRIANMSAQRTVRTLKMAPYIGFRRIMTGTPIANAPWDAFAQVKFVDDDFWRGHGLDSPEAMKAAFGEWEKTARRVPLGMANREKSLQYYYRNNNIPECLQTHFVKKDGFALQFIPKLETDIDGRPRYKNLEKLRDILAPIRSRVLKSEVLDLPPKVYSRLEFDMSPKQRALYDQMRDQGFAIMEGGQCSANMALTILLRLQQIACGYLVTDLEEGQEDPKVLPIDPNPRLELLAEAVSGITHPGIIWARFTPDIDAICARLQKMGLTVARYDGGISDEECFQNEERFHRGEAQWFVSNQAKGGEGLTLVEARSMFYYSNSFKLRERLQSEDRPHRYGQTHSVGVTDLFARGTMEERLLNSLIDKFDVASIVVGDGHRNWIQPIGRLL
jgi:hypothetical protein